MKTKHLLLILLLPLLAAQCKKDEAPDLPSCDYVFECKVNGQTWKPKARWNCPDVQISYSPDTIGNLIGGRMLLDGQQCLETYVGTNSITIVLDSLFLGSQPMTTLFLYRYVTEEYASMPREQAKKLYDYDSVLTSSITINEFIPDNYSQDWQGGYIKMSFSATLMNGVGETVQITDGRICQRFQ